MNLNSEDQVCHAGYRSRRFRSNSPVRRSATCSYCDNNERPHRSIYNECDEPYAYKGGDGPRTDFGCQVVATDINYADDAQTGNSLCQMSGEVTRKRRCHGTAEMLGRRNWNLYSDCEKPRKRCPKNQGGPILDCASQADPRDICESDCTQTGPSLCAKGPYCKFDYKLRKTHPPTEDCYADCRRPKQQEPQIPCSADRYVCTSFNQQVTAADINITNWAQADEKERCESKDDRIKSGKTHPKFSRKMVKSDHLLDCDCPSPQSNRERRSTRNFTMQVSPSCISPSKQIQTDRCPQPGTCRKARVLRCRDWEECECVIINRKRESLGDQCSSTQVTATDICECDEAQTTTGLAKRKPFKRTCSESKVTCQGKNHVLIGRATSFGIDPCACPLAMLGPGKPVESCTQVQAYNISRCQESQTGNGKSTVVKRFVRGGPWR